MNKKELDNLLSEITKAKNKLINLNTDLSPDDSKKLSSYINSFIEASDALMPDLNSYVDNHKMLEISHNGNNENFIKTYTLDYLGKYHFYEEEEFLKENEENEYILQQLKANNRFDYKGRSYTFSKYGNISKGLTDRNVKISFVEESLNVLINDIPTHLDLIYKLDIKKLEDHIRIATRISEKGPSTSCLMYIDYSQGDAFIEALNYVKNMQIEQANIPD